MKITIATLFIAEDGSDKEVASRDFFNMHDAREEMKTLELAGVEFSVKWDCK